MMPDEPTSFKIHQICDLLSLAPCRLRPLLWGGRLGGCNKLGHKALNYALTQTLPQNRTTPTVI